MDVQSIENTSDLTVIGSTTHTFGWETSQQMERQKPSVWQRLRPGRREINAVIGSLVVFLLLFAASCWLADNPFSNTQRVVSPLIEAQGWAGTNNWSIMWWVVAIAVILEFLDASAGMGYGTAITPLLLVIGFDPLQIVPAVMIQQAIAGLLGAFLHREFGNVDWRLKPMSETVKLWLIIAIIGCLAAAMSITTVYGLLKLAKVWIKLYVAVLLVGMGIIALVGRRRELNYKPHGMFLFGALAGFNKGIGGGGYGPVVTVGGVLSGVPIKSMMAVTALSEGTVCLFSVIVWLVMLTQGVILDFVLLPSMLLGSMIAAIAAPYATRVFPERMWRLVVPTYCLILAVYSLWKIVPEIFLRISG